MKKYKKSTGYRIKIASGLQDMRLAPIFERTVCGNHVARTCKKLKSQIGQHITFNIVEI